jgi:hypothetical protein
MTSSRLPVLAFIPDPGYKILIYCALQDRVGKCFELLSELFSCTKQIQNTKETTGTYA